MADPLLTSLCTICRIQEPKYKCPRCGARTCSLSCVKKHKNWSSCNGERDPTVFVALDKLKTDAGIDHDYNFLTKIERSVERAERILREDREILPQGSSHPPPHKKTRLNKGQSRGKTTVDDGARKWDRNAMHRMRQLSIHVSSVPYGMTRSKENNTSWNRRTRTINWQVEWLFFNAGSPTATGSQPQPRRMLHKALDETPLCIAFAEALETDRHRQMTDHERVEEKKAHRRQQIQRQRPQDLATGAWQRSSCLMQNHTDGSWSRLEDADGSHIEKKFRFFVPKPKAASGEPQTLVPLNASDTLASLLPGRQFVEFPTIYVLSPKATELGREYIIEENNMKKPTTKRKASTLVDYESGAELPEEAGQIIGQGAEAETSDDTTSSSGSDTEMSD
ncbi:hypothetical protein NUW58_g5123 [Xylaria curta]|uniref:Uncharacterized protein n=1 Tax=Xylaria curta TaxID=42375 RepID=A0ACC1P341_9PEZI|nr:hypothetical protein NUW58_g5123 [Xylaria curta]